MSKMSRTFPKRLGHGLYQGTMMCLHLRFYIYGKQKYWQFYLFLEFHRGIRDAMCDLCGKGYANQRLLRKHIKTHAAVKDHICPECGKDFVTSTQLNIHRRIHTGKKPYQCKICAYKGAKKGNVQAHVRKVHNITNDVVTVNEYVIEHLDEIERLGKPWNKRIAAKPNMLTKCLFNGGGGTII